MQYFNATGHLIQIYSTNFDKTTIVTFSVNPLNKERKITIKYAFKVPRIVFLRRKFFKKI